MSLFNLVKTTVFVSFLALTSASQGDCPAWFFPDADNSTRCVCSINHHENENVKCSKDTALSRIGFCMTYNNITKDTEFGMCPYIFQRIILSSVPFFFRLPNTTSSLTSFMCGSLHRKGLLCGECEDGFGPALHSNTLECKRCWGHGFGWLLYISLTFLPTTVLYFILVLFHISASSPLLKCVFLFCHSVIMCTPFVYIPLLYSLFVNEIGGFSSVVLRIMLALCGLWNLDLFIP